MKLEWDEGKNQSNITKHGLDFADATAVFNRLQFTDACLP
ncbi:BrnT family toxin [Desmonostoc muscorum LEGE 12446]|nr:BrnT family toxin [Desmonostoc muscorum]MCF2147508.1 BrnT family toxin [Desmonostoc muscorum LEGE 12446]